MKTPPLVLGKHVYDYANYWDCLVTLDILKFVHTDLVCALAVLAEWQTKHTLTMLKTNTVCVIFKALNILAILLINYRPPGLFLYDMTHCLDNFANNLLWNLSHAGMLLRNHSCFEGSHSPYYHVSGPKYTWSDCHRIPYFHAFDLNLPYSH